MRGTVERPAGLTYQDAAAGVPVGAPHVPELRYSVTFRTVRGHAVEAVTDAGDIEEP